MKIKLRTILLWFFIGLLSLGQFQRIEFTGSLSNVNVYFHDIFIFLWLVGFSFIYASKFKDFTCFTSKNLIKKTIKKFKIEVIFISIVMLGIILNIIQNKDFISMLYNLRLFGYLLFGLSLKTLVLNKKMIAEDLRFKFFGFGLIILILGYLQLIFVKDTRFLAILGWDDHFNRLISTIFDPGFTGIILLISYFYFLSLERFKNNKIVTTIITLNFFWGIALTFSRATYLVLIISLLGLGVIKNSKTKNQFTLKKSLLYISIFIIMILLTPKPGGEGVDLSRTSSISARKLGIFQQILAIKPKTLLIGNGLFSKQNSLNYLLDNENQYSSDQINNNLIPSHSRVPDNLFINLLLSTGILGTGLVVFLIIKWLVKIITPGGQVQTDPELFIAILATLIHAQFSNSMLQPFVLLMLLGGIASKKSYT
jgi:hypothetical protein